MLDVQIIPSLLTATLVSPKGCPAREQETRPSGFGRGDPVMSDHTSPRHLRNILRISIHLFSFLPPLGSALASSQDGRVGLIKQGPPKLQVGQVLT